MAETAKIGDVVDTVLKRLGTHSGPRRKTTDWDCVWNRVAGDIARAHSHVERYARGVLCIRADSTACAADLNLRRQELLSALRKEFGCALKRLEIIV